MLRDNNNRKRDDVLRRIQDGGYETNIPEISRTDKVPSDTASLLKSLAQQRKVDNLRLHNLFNDHLKDMICSDWTLTSGQADYVIEQARTFSKYGHHSLTPGRITGKSHRDSMLNVFYAILDLIEFCDELMHNQ